MNARTNFTDASEYPDFSSLSEPDIEEIVASYAAACTVANPEQRKQFFRTMMTAIIRSERMRVISDEAAAIAKKRAEQEEQRANVDPLTGLYNKAFLENAIGRFLELTTAANLSKRKKQTTGLLLYIDLDSFKPINDQAGHAAGDAALQSASFSLVARITERPDMSDKEDEVLEQLRESLRETDIVARVGGDEFAIFLAGTDLKDAHVVIGKIQDTLDNLSVIHNARTFKFGGSMGIAEIRAGMSVKEVFDAADKNMFENKERRKGQGQAPVR